MEEALEMSAQEKLFFGVCPSLQALAPRLGLGLALGTAAPSQISIEADGPGESDVPVADQARIRHQFLEAGQYSVFLRETRTSGLLPNLFSTSEKLAFWHKATWASVS